MRKHADRRSNLCQRFKYSLASPSGTSIPPPPVPPPPGIHHQLRQHNFLKFLANFPVQLNRPILRRMPMRPLDPPPRHILGRYTLNNPPTRPQPLRRPNRILELIGLGKRAPVKKYRQPLVP